MRITRVVSGGQSGVDQAGLRAARACDIPTGGWAPLGWLTEDGPAPWLAEFGLVECQAPGYPARTEANARDSDATLWLGSTDSRGYAATAGACRKHGKPLFHAAGRTPTDALDWLKLVAGDEATVNVAGSRESRAPGIGARAERWLAALFRRVADSDAPPASRAHPPGSHIKNPEERGHEVEDNPDQ
jgi:hypothetical protein